MGIADRDYARPAGSRGVADPRARVGRVSPLSVNTWLVIINIAVFVVGHYLIPPHLGWQVTTGKFPHPKVDSAALRDGLVATWITRPIPSTQYLYHPIYDPASMVVDRTGTPIRDPDGHPQYLREIGLERISPMPILDAFGHFSTGKGFFEFQVWRFITFQFLHADITHIVFNMMGLWLVGGIVEEYLGRKRYLAFYLACGLFGAVSYLVLNTLGYAVLMFAPQWRGVIPALLFDDPYMPLIGASAGVFGVLMATTYVAPNEIVDVVRFIPMRLRTVVYIFLALAVINLMRGGHNAGGDAAHVGGAIAGVILIRRAHWLRDFFDVLDDSRKPQWKSDAPSPATIDRILDKVRAEGLESLTPAEREALRRETMAAREQQGD
jgi:membrane associated rhomboid family serine protease